MKNIFLLTIASLFFIVSCNSPKATIADKKPMTEAEIILQKAVEAHGGSKYDKAHFGFTFRDKYYSFKNNKEQYAYSVDRSKDGEKIIDYLENGVFKRMENGKVAVLTDKKIRSYTGGLNSVIYFATLPHKLQDAAVNKKYRGTTSIKNKTYEIIEITFNEEGGGTDHDDVFHYWINQETKVIDYLAYNYQVNGGGVRFRSAYNSRRVGGIVFQDYVNYKAEVGTPLADLPKLYEQEKLKKLSLIETENVVELKN